MPEHHIGYGLNLSRKKIVVPNRQPGITVRLNASFHLTFAVEDGNVIGGQSRLGLDTDQQRTSTTGCYTLSGEMNALEAQREGTFLQIELRLVKQTDDRRKVVKFQKRITYELLNDLFNQFPERVGGMLGVDVFNELGNDLSIGLRLKLVSLIFQKLLDVLVVGNDSYCQGKQNINMASGQSLILAKEYRCGRQ